MQYVIINGERYRVDTAQGYKVAKDALERAKLDSVPILTDEEDFGGKPTGETFELYDYEPKAIALAEVLSVSPLSNIGYDGRSESDPHARWTSDDDPGEYLVLDDSERETLWDESLENYIDECILPELPDAYRGYFDSDAWKRDAEHDGAGHSLATYDGVEHEAMIDGEWYFVYRVG